MGTVGLLNNNSIQRTKRFFVSGVTGAGVHFLVLILSKEILGVGIVLATTVAFIVASTISFILQKFWTFKNNSKEAIPYQVTTYLMVALANVFINGFLMSLLVKNIGIYYIIAQIITSALIAIESFILYQQFVFKKNI